jgi:hypothetical protein
MQHGWGYSNLFEMMAQTGQLKKPGGGGGAGPAKAPGQAKGAPSGAPPAGGAQPKPKK